MSDGGQIVSPEVLFRQYIEETATDITEQMRAGRPPDYANYRELVGVLKGLDVAFKHWMRAQSGVNIDPPPRSFKSSSVRRPPAEDWLT
jgi:hypothetical protein